MPSQLRRGASREAEGRGASPQEAEGRGASPRAAGGRGSKVYFSYDRDFISAVD